MKDRNCTVDGCDRKYLARGMCGMHYQRVQNLGTTELPIKEPRICSIEGCSGSVWALGYCQLHYRRWSRYGDPHVVNNQNGENNPRWSGDEISYGGMHIRIRDNRGPASEHPCVDCGSQAYEWSYDHTGLNERVEDGLRYSTDIGQYSPRCKPCHKAFDTRERATA
jgi:hypothetical protein